MARATQHRKRTLRRAAFAALLSSLAASGAARAAAPVAIVQEITAPDTGLEFMAYAREGDTVALGRDGRLVLGYFESCIEETVTGGQVTVGVRQSSVVGGAVERRPVSCDGGGLALTEQQAARSGVIVFRKGAAASAVAKPSIRLHGASPLLRADHAGTFAITRLDAPAPPIELAAPDGVADLARHGIVLAPGGIYRAELRMADGIRARVFEVDAFAVPGAAPIVSRLLRM